MLSATSDHAIRAMLVLAREYKQRPVRTIAALLHWDH